MNLREPECLDSSSMWRVTAMSARPSSRRRLYIIQSIMYMESWTVGASLLRPFHIYDILSAFLFSQPLLCCGFDDQRAVKQLPSLLF